MKNKNVRGLLALVVVTALSFGVILGSKALAKDTGSFQMLSAILPIPMFSERTLFLHNSTMEEATLCMD